MITVRSSIEISRPVDQVFLYAGDYRNDIFWRKGVILMECEPSGMLQTGTITRETMLAFGNRNMTIAKITEYDPCKRTAFEALHGPIPCKGFRTFEPTPTGTRFTYSLTLRPSGWRSLMLPGLYPILARQIRHDLRRLAAILERDHATEVEALVTGDHERSPGDTLSA